jgi:hypothetical protein
VATLLTDPSITPVLPGSTFYFEVVTEAAVPASIGATVFVRGAADWGPVNQAEQYDSATSFAEGSKDAPGFGRSTTELARNVVGAFLGEGLAGKGGASSVIVYRQAHSDAAVATKNFNNTTPVPALTLTAKYPGTRGNGFGITHRNGYDTTLDELVVIENGREIETYDYVIGDINSLAAAINSTSSVLTATATVSGVALTDVVNVQLLGGSNGGALTAGDWTDMFAKLEFEPFSVFSAAGLTDGSITTALIAWKDDVAERGKPMFIFVGGPSAESFSAHRTRAAGFNDPDVMVLGTGDIGDSTITGDGTELVMSTSQAASRVAGSVARRGETMDMVNVRYDGWRIINGPTRAQAEVAVQSGMTVVVRDGDPQAPTKISLGVTSYTSDTGAMPKWVYGNVKFVRTNHGIETDLTADQEHDLIDGSGVTPKAREIILGRAKTVINNRIRLGIIQAASTVEFDPDVVTSDTDDFVALVYDVEYVRGIRTIRNRIRLS